MSHPVTQSGHDLGDDGGHDGDHGGLGHHDSRHRRQRPGKGPHRSGDVDGDLDPKPGDAALAKPWDEQAGDVGGAHGVAVVAGRHKAVGAVEVAALSDLIDQGLALAGGDRGVEVAGGGELVGDEAAPGRHWDHSSSVGRCGHGIRAATTRGGYEMAEQRRSYY